MLYRLLTVMAAMMISSAASAASFEKARPVWPKGRETERNLTVGFRADFDAEPGQKVQLRLSGSTVYRCFLNGNFVAHGPARGPHGFYRVDELDLSPHVRRGHNFVAVEVAGYNANSFVYLDQPSFLQAEVVVGNKVVAATSGNGETFRAVVPSARVKKTQRISFQRPFSEAYRLNPASDSWIRGDMSNFAPEVLAETEEKKLIPRRIPYFRFQKISPVRRAVRGTARHEPPKDFWVDRCLVDIGPKLIGFPPDELEICTSREFQPWVTDKSEKLGTAWNPEEPIELGEKNFEIVDLGSNLTGFIGATITCTTPTRLFISFDEVLRNDDVDFLRMGMMKAIPLDLEPGTYQFESFEPYTLQVAKFLVAGGGATIKDVYLRELANDDVWESSFACSDPRLNKLFEAARQTFRQNAPDVFMDCPSRERAGWLCDSFFTARAARDFCSNTTLETNFLENFLLPQSFEHIPDGMLPMCYPSDHYDGVFIPNWSLWFVVQLEEYLARTGDRELVNALEPRVMQLFDWFTPHENENGLLEKLPGWIFVEWSKAAEFVQDVNYPTNMLYSGALAAAGRMYNRHDLRDKSEQVKWEIQKQSFDGEFFVDNAVRKEGRLEVTRNRSEACQYYAAFFGVATPETHGPLWKKLLTEFGPEREKSGTYPEIHSANTFIGDTLRLEILGRAGLTNKLTSELLAYFGGMAEETNTIWENRHSHASLNHGFGSHAGHHLVRDVAGIANVDPVGRKVTIKIPESDLEWCESRVHAGDGFATLRWTRDGKMVRWSASVPAGYQLEVSSAPGVELVRD